MENKIYTRSILLISIFGIFIFLAFLRLIVSPLWGITNKEWNIKIPPERGEILDRNGRVLASDTYVYKAYLDLDFLKRVYDDSDKGTKLEIERDLYLLTKLKMNEILSKGNFLFLGESKDKNELLSKIPPTLLKFVNISMSMTRKRTSGSSLPTIIGKVIDRKGVSGVEEYYDKILRGKRAGRIVLKYTGFINLQPTIEKFIRPMNGSDVTLSIDIDLQRIVYEDLLKTVKDSSALSGNAILMESKTGKILAMVTTNTWNDNVLGYIEPGSTIKPVIYSIALQTKAASPSFHHNCTGRIRPVKNLNIFIRDIKPHGEVDMEKALVVSCNTATVKIAELIKKKIGIQGFYEWLRKFGFGEKTGIEIPGESSGLLRDPKHWSAIDFAEISIGQGIGVTPIQLISAINTVVNGGIYVKPSLNLNSPVEKRRVIDEKVADTIRKFMVQVVEHGTGERAKIPGLKIAGKTGTAQKAIGGKYVKKYHSLFVGAFPASDPKYILLVHIDDPKGDYLGGDVAAPTFARIVSDMMGMKERKPLKVFKNVMPNLIGLSLKDVLTVSKILGIEPKIHGSGIVKKQTPPPGTIDPRHIEVWLGF